MESTGVYGMPVVYELEEASTWLLVSAAHITQVPGRKTDVKDCMWIAQCLEHGLLRGSFVPPAAIREIRDLTRHRKVLIQERTRAANRVHKLLEDAGIKLTRLIGLVVIFALSLNLTFAAAETQQGETKQSKDFPGGVVFVERIDAMTDERLCSVHTP